MGLPQRFLQALTVTNVLSISWFFLIWWGEHFAFRNAIARCQWNRWETLSSPLPYRIALIADPQLVDENTYTRRGILLKLSQFFTDLYMKRNWRYIQNILHPKISIFMGDLMDGGREWDDRTWEKEYQRFRRIFPRTTSTPYIASLPGNHDIGVADTVSKAAAARFTRHFGDLSTELQAGDFTVVLLDTVSLSAEKTPGISRPVWQFLENYSKGDAPPRILLTHIPLYRAEGTSCGPLRESSNPIHVGKGYQYQNVLTPDLSSRIVDIVRPLAVFSGDDHDYCFVQHNYGGMKIPEHTIKSFSWAMGINNPGFQLLSLSSSHSDVPTSPQFSTTPCILPNQLHIFIIYGVMLLITIISIIIKNWIRIQGRLPILPTSNHKRDDDKWKASSSGTVLGKHYRELLANVLRDLRPIALSSLPWYIWLIWY